MKTSDNYEDRDEVVAYNKIQFLKMLRQRKQDLNLTYDELAERSGCGRNYIGYILSPKGIKKGGNDIGLSVLIKLIMALDLTVTIDIEHNEDDR